MADNFQIEHVVLSDEKDIDKALTNLYKPANGVKIVQTESFSFKADMGTIIHDTYIPDAYNRHYTASRKSRRNQNYNNVPFQRLGVDNKFPLFLKDLTNKSSLHRSAWLAASNLAHGQGLSPKNKEGEPFLEWLRARGVDASFTMFSLKQIARYGGAYANLRFANKSRRNRTKKLLLSRVQKAKFENHRLGKPNSNEKSNNYGKIEYVWHHPNFSHPKPDPEYLRGMPLYKRFVEVRDNPMKIVKNDQTTPYFKGRGRGKLNSNWYVSPIWDDSLDSEVYPTPYYQSDTLFDSSILDAALSAFDTAMVKNGMAAQYVITVPMNGIEALKRRDENAAKEKIAKARNKIKDELTGEDNAGVAVVVIQDVASSNSGVVPIKIEEIPNTNNANIHKVLDQRKYRNIMTAWGVTDSRLIGAPPIFGMGLSDQSEILKAAESIWYNAFVYPEIAKVYENWIHRVLKPLWLMEKGIKNSDSTKPEMKAEVCLRRKNMFTPNPSDYVLDRFMSDDEIRDRFNLPPLTEEQKKEISKRNLRKKANNAREGASNSSNTDFDGGGSGNNDRNQRRQDNKRNQEEKAALHFFSTIAEEHGMSIEELKVYIQGQFDA